MVRGEPPRLAWLWARLSIGKRKAAANRAKDRESLDRLRSFRDYWLRTRRV
jgi:hypothetical protein